VHYLRAKRLADVYSLQQAFPVSPNTKWVW